MKASIKAPLKLALGIGGTVVAVSVSVLALRLVLTPVNLANTAITSAQGVTSRTLNSDNVIASYEAFHDLNAAYLGRVRQINATRAYFVSETAPDERNRLRIELSAQQMSCRDIANRYNAASAKTNKSIFKGRDAPETLSAEACE